MAAFYLQRYFSLVNWRTVLRAGDGYAKTASQAKCLNVDLLISSFRGDFFSPTQPSLLKSSWTNLPTEAEIHLGIKGASPTPVAFLGALLFAHRGTQAPCSSPCTQFLSRSSHCQTGLITNILPLSPLKRGACNPEGSWSCSKGLQADSAAPSNILT